MKTPLTIALALTTMILSMRAQEKSDMKDCPMMKTHTDEVNTRGDSAMGFAHEKTTHHFRLTSTGGAIEVAANDAADEASRAQIRGHLGHIAQMFSEGNFAIPMLVHAQNPPGAAAMKQLKDKIQYRYEETPNGGRVLITTRDAAALQAVQEFLRFQIIDHQTGDSTVVRKD